MKLRIGYGIDFHQLVEGRDLVIGGVTIPHHKGALGHSDADVLLHAICDALLGAACLGDIGVHFPDTSMEFKNIDSKILLAKTRVLIEAEGYSVGNIDASLCLEAISEDKYEMDYHQMEQLVVNYDFNPFITKEQKTLNFKVFNG